MPDQTFSPDLLAELNALLRFDPDDTLHGLKIHKDAPNGVAAAVQRLHARGLLTQIDGGYLTPLGREASAHANTLLGLLTTGQAASIAGN